jgi:expansin (peptidoglycan-binding protein)
MTRHRPLALCLVLISTAFVAAAGCDGEKDRSPDGTGGSGNSGNSGNTGGSGNSGNTGGDPGPPPDCTDPNVHQGEATYYDFANGDGACMFGPSSEDPLMIGAMNQTDYAASAVCGACVRLTGPNGTIDVRMVDLCPECPQGNIDLSPDAFALIAPLEQGRVDITWSYNECAVAGPIRYRFKEGANQWWTAVQVRNHRNAIATFEYRDGGNNWVPVARTDYNYFVEAAGMGPGPYAFRVTDVYGNQLVDEGIGFIEAGEVAGAGQFPSCEGG